MEVFSYQVKAYAPNPERDNDFFTYDSVVQRDKRLDLPGQMEALKKGLAAHIFKQKGVSVDPETVFIQSTELVDFALAEAFPAGDGFYSMPD